MKNTANYILSFSGALIIMAATIACGQETSNNLPKPADSSEARANASSSNDSSGATSLPPSAQSPADTAKLAGTWFLVAALPSDTAAGKVPVLVFDAGGKNFSGNTGCNNMRGTYSATDSTLKISEQVVTTRMACPGYNEQGFLSNLPRATGYRFENGMLVLLDGQSELSRWTRKPVTRTIKST